MMRMIRAEVESLLDLCSLEDVVFQSEEIRAQEELAFLRELNALNTSVVEPACIEFLDWVRSRGVVCRVARQEGILVSGHSMEALVSVSLMMSSAYGGSNAASGVELNLLSDRKTRKILVSRSRSIRGRQGAGAHTRSISLPELDRSFVHAQLSQMVKPLFD